jgi:hypothetical protein
MVLWLSRGPWLDSRLYSKRAAACGTVRGSRRSCRTFDHEGQLLVEMTDGKRIQKRDSSRSAWTEIP